MAVFFGKLLGQFRSQHYNRAKFESTIINCVKNAASAGPALANAAMLVAQGCPKRYTEVLTALYTANQLPCPDFTVLFDQYMTETHESGYHSVPEETQEPDEVQSFLRDIEDVEELPASMDEVLDILTDFDTFEDSTDQSATTDLLLKIDDHRISFNATRSICNESLLQIDDECLSFNSNFYALSLPNADDSVRFEKSPFAFTGPALPILNSPMLSPINKNRITSFSTPSKCLHQLKSSTPAKFNHSRLHNSDYSPIIRTLSTKITTARTASTLSLSASTYVALCMSSNISRTKSASTLFRVAPTPVGVDKSSITRTNSASTLFQAQSTPVGVGKSFNISRTKSASTLSLTASTSVGVGKFSNINRTKSSSSLSLAASMPVGVGKCSNITRTKSVSTLSLAASMSFGVEKSYSRSPRPLVEITDEDSFLIISLSEIYNHDDKYKHSILDVLGADTLGIVSYGQMLVGSYEA